MASMHITHLQQYGACPAEFYLVYAPVPDEVWLAFTAITGLIAILAMALLLHLLGFHCYLSESFD
jgi:hypothetical protein